MRVSDLQTLYDYNYWANARILKAAANVSDEQFVASSTISHGGLRGTLLHTLAAEWIWRKRCHEKVSPTALFSADDFAALIDLLENYGGLAYTEKAAASYIDTAKTALSVFEPSQTKDTMLDIANYALSRRV